MDQLEAHLAQRVEATVADLLELVKTGVRHGWAARDSLCTDRHCSKCHRKDHHSGIEIPKKTKQEIAERFVVAILSQMQHQAAQDAYLRAKDSGLYLPAGLRYNRGEPEEPS